MNSLLHLNGPNADHWRAIFVRYFEQYLEGSKAPDTQFKDFRNHVLHVTDNFWGGAVGQAEKWYDRTVEDLKNQDWRSAAYSAGVLSHYYMDPLMPLHTGQTEEEGVIHRACEWSVNKSFASLIGELESTTGYPEVKFSDRMGWLKEGIHTGATLANEFYQDFIDHYDIEVGSKKPEEGLDEHLREITSQLLGHASVGFARILERAIAESGSVPAVKPATSFWKWFYTLTQPVSWLYGFHRNFLSRSAVRKIRSEYRRDGKVVDALPVDEKTVRKEHAEEVLDISLAELDSRKIGKVGSLFKPRETTKPTRQPSTPTDEDRKEDQPFRLELDDKLEAAPSIGPKTAKRFAAVGIVTVGQFLLVDPDEVSAQLSSRHIQPDTIIQWQTQAKLACQIPRIYGHDAQILVACGFDSAEEVAQSEPEVVLSLVDDFVATPEAKFIVRGKRPDMTEVTNWVQWAAESRQLDAA